VTQQAKIIVPLSVHVAGRQGEGKEINESTVKQRKTGVGECYLETEKGHHGPEVKRSNEIICDYIWGKRYPSPQISVTCSKWYKESPLWT
jgi:hypothetical protein